jgi:hypothetical protein
MFIFSSGFPLGCLYTDNCATETLFTQRCYTVLTYSIIYTVLTHSIIYTVLTYTTSYIQCWGCWWTHVSATWRNAVSTSTRVLGWFQFQTPQLQHAFIREFFFRFLCYFLRLQVAEPVLYIHSCRVDFNFIPVTCLPVDCVCVSDR